MTRTILITAPTTIPITALSGKPRLGSMKTVGSGEGIRDPTPVEVVELIFIGWPIPTVTSMFEVCGGATSKLDESNWLVSKLEVCSRLVIVIKLEIDNVLNTDLEVGNGLITGLLVDVELDSERKDCVDVAMGLETDELELEAMLGVSETLWIDSEVEDGDRLVSMLSGRDVLSSDVVDGINSKVVDGINSEVEDGVRLESMLRDSDALRINSEVEGGDRLVSMLDVLDTLSMEVVDAVSSEIEDGGRLVSLLRGILCSELDVGDKLN